MTYIARLDKTGLKVLCAHPNCGQIASVHELRHRDGLWVTRELIMPAYMTKQADGAWAPIAHARRQIALGLPPNTRRGYVNSADVRGHRALGLPVDERPHRRLAVVHDLPAVAVCPRCGHRNTLDPTVLRVMTRDEYAARLGVDTA